MKSGQIHFKILSALVRIRQDGAGMGMVQERGGTAMGDGFWIASEVTSVPRHCRHRPARPQH